MYVGCRIVFLEKDDVEHEEVAGRQVHEKDVGRLVEFSFCNDEDVVHDVEGNHHRVDGEENDLPGFHHGIMVLQLFSWP